MVTVYVPSLGRNQLVSTSAASTARNFSRLAPRWRSQLRFVVSEAEHGKYSLLTHSLGLPEPLVCSKLGISATRQWIAEQDHEKFFMIDDDMRFARRCGVGPSALKELQVGELDQLMDELEKTLDSYAHVAVSARGGNNRCGPEHGGVWPHPDRKECARANNFHGFVSSVLRENEVRFDAVPVMEDFHVTLSLLELGFPNLVFYDFCWDQGASGQPGGCSTYRDAKLQDEAARRLCELHPDFVKLVEKQARSGWKSMETRTDVHVQWMKALGAKA